MKKCIPGSNAYFVLLGFQVFQKVPTYIWVDEVMFICNDIELKAIQYQSCDYEMESITVEFPKNSCTHQS